MGAASIPLPERRHVPGVNRRPDEAAFDAVKAQVPAVTVSARAADNPAWRYGVRLFNEGYYWEAHEVLEPVWLNAVPNSRERHLVQALIHLANGRLKEIMGRPRARSRLAQLGRKSIEAAFPHGGGDVLMGLASGDLLQAASDLRDGRFCGRLKFNQEI